MRRRRAALLTLLVLVGLVAVPVVLTWREVKQEQLNHALIAAVDHNDAAEVRRWLRQGADPNAKDDFGETPLFWLFHHNFALRHDIVDYSGKVWLQDPRICAPAILLLQSGASTHIKDREGETLMSMAQSWDSPLIQILKQAAAKDEGDHK
jgi:hypothetical protein